MGLNDKNQHYLSKVTGS